MTDHAKHLSKDLSRSGLGNCIRRLLALTLQYIYPISIDLLGLLLDILRRRAIPQMKVRLFVCSNNKACPDRSSYLSSVGGNHLQ